jgi:hypothetical protein
MNHCGVPGLVAEHDVDDFGKELGRDAHGRGGGPMSLGGRIEALGNGESRDIEHFYGVEPFVLAARMLPKVAGQVLCINGQVNHASPKVIDSFRRDLTACVDRGVRVQLVCHPEELELHRRLKFVRDLSARPGGEVRITDAALEGVYLFDRNRALVWESTRHRPRHCILIRGPLAEPLVRLAESTWESCSPLEDFLRCRNGVLDQITPMVLSLLGAGHKDEVAARMLGVSVRTYRRYVADLMLKLDARSRFEAGMLASKLGLVSGSAAVDEVEPGVA